jgi:hypothetical protein
MGIKINIQSAYFIIQFLFCKSIFCQQPNDVFFKGKFEISLSGNQFYEKVAYTSTTEYLLAEEFPLRNYRHGYNSIYSMYTSDTIYYANNIEKRLAYYLLDRKKNSYKSDFEVNYCNIDSTICGIRCKKFLVKYNLIFGDNIPVLIQEYDYIADLADFNLEYFKKNPQSLMFNEYFKSPVLKKISLPNIITGSKGISFEVTKIQKLDTLINMKPPYNYEFKKIDAELGKIIFTSD